jgi:hypothetical protein
MDMLEEMGVVGDAVGGGRARRVLIARGEDPFKRIIDKRMKDKLRQQKRDDGHWNDYCSKNPISQTRQSSPVCMRITV